MLYSFKKKKKRRNFKHFWNRALNWAGSWDGGTRITLTFFSCFQYKRNCLLHNWSLQGKVLALFCPFHSSLDVPVLRSWFHLELCNLCLVLFQAIMCFMCNGVAVQKRNGSAEVWKGFTAPGTQKSIFLAEWFHVGVIALNFVYTSQSWSSVGETYYRLFLLCTNKNNVFWNISIAPKIYCGFWCTLELKKKKKK